MGYWNVWRLPVVAAAVLAASATLTVTLDVPITLRSAASSVIARAAASAAVVGVLLASRAGVDWFVLHFNNMAGLPRKWIDPSPLVLIAPAVWAALLVLLRLWLFRELPPGRSLWLWRSAFFAASFAFLAANLVNGCNPGWCERFDLPFTYFSASDAFVSFNGEVPTDFSPLGLALDIATFGAIAGLFRRSFVRSLGTQRGDAP